MGLDLTYIFRLGVKNRTKFKKILFKFNKEILINLKVYFNRFKHALVVGSLKIFLQECVNHNIYSVNKTSCTEINILEI